MNDIYRLLLSGLSAGVVVEGAGEGKPKQLHSQLVSLIMGD